MLRERYDLTATVPSHRFLAARSTIISPLAARRHYSLESHA